MSRQKAIIFGISGQDGYYLSKRLLQQQIEVTGVSRSGGNWIQGSVANFELVDSLIKTTKPDYIFHLAANSATRHELLFE
ncbi:MAG: NAD-dependent epimerase/dehydratase family protein, partial [Chitinophagaceae bacterium]